jgi:hypothetical protein
MEPGGRVFADLVRALATVRAYDIDVSIPRSLARGGRPPLIELIRAARFEVDAFDPATGLLEIQRDSVPLDLLTEAPDPREPIAILGQGDLKVQGYPHQYLLRQNTRSMLVGVEVDESLNEPVPNTSRGTGCGRS